MLPFTRYLRHEIHVIFRANPRRGLRLAADQVRVGSSCVVTQAMAHRFILYHLMQGEWQITPDMMSDVLDLFEWFLTTPSIPTWMLNELRKVSRRHAHENFLAELVSEDLAAREHAHMHRLLEECASTRVAA